MIIFVSPDSFTSFAGQPEAFPKTWPRHWGAQLWAINFLYLPGYRDPVRHRWPNWMGIIIRLAFAVFFFSQGEMLAESAGPVQASVPRAAVAPMLAL